MKFRIGDIVKGINHLSWLGKGKIVGINKSNYHIRFFNYDRYEDTKDDIDFHIIYFHDKDIKLDPISYIKQKKGETQ